MLADNLILLRGLKGLTQEQAAEIAGGDATVLLQVGAGRNRAGH